MALTLLARHSGAPRFFQTGAGEPHQLPPFGERRMSQEIGPAADDAAVADVALCPQLTPVQHKAAVLLAAGAKPALVAEQCDVNVAAVRGWQKLPAMQREVDALVRHGQQALLRQAYGRLPAVLSALMDDATNMELRPTERAAAAKILLDRIPLTPSMAFDTDEARQEAKQATEGAARYVPPVEMLDILRAEIEITRINNANAARASRMTTYEGPRVIEGELDDEDDDL
jgi:hypothetical protein